MKGILEFDLPEEQEEFNLANNAQDLAGAIREYREYIRHLNKYGHSFSDADMAVNQMSKTFYSKLEFYGIDV